MRYITLIALLTFCLSFTGSTPDYEKFKSWYAENSSKLVLSNSVKQFNFQLRYIPKELKVLREVAGNNDLASEDLKSLNAKYNQYHEFSFKISVEGIQNILNSYAADEEEYNTLLFYLLEDISQDFELVTTTGEKKPLQCDYENNYGAAPFISLHLVFEKDKNETLKSLKYHDLLFGNGFIEYELNTINELKIPQIK